MCEPVSAWSESAIILKSELVCSSYDKNTVWPPNSELPNSENLRIVNGFAGTDFF